MPRIAATEFIIGIYLRISADSEGKGLGIARQEKEIRAYIKRRWPKARIQVVKYADNDVSATKKVARPKYDELCTDIAAGKLQAVVVWAYDRLCRRLADLEAFLSLLDAHPVEVGCVSGDIDLATPMGRTLARIIASIAAGEIETLKWRIKAKQRELAEAGKVGNGGHRPYGYTFKRDEIIDDEAAIVREIASRILAGESLGGIARDLNKRKVPPARAGAWSVTAVRAVVIKPHVAALRVYQGKIFGDAVWPAILDRGTWEAVCAVVNGRKQGAGHNARKHLLSGIATCQLCDGRMQVNLGGSGGRPMVPRYRCRECGRVSKNQFHLDEYVIQRMLNLLQTHDLRPGDTGPVVHVSTEIAALQQRREQTVDSWADLGMDQHDLRRALMRIDTRLEELQRQRQTLQAPHVFDGLSGISREQWDQLPLDRRRTAVAAAFTVSVGAANRRGMGFDETSVDVARVARS